MRYARKVEFNLKSGQENEFNRIFESRIMPELQKQRGFQDELLLTAGRQVTAISLWDKREDAENYEKATQGKVFDALKPVIETTPKFQACDVPFATFHAAV